MKVKDKELMEKLDSMDCRPGGRTSSIRYVPKHVKDRLGAAKKRRSSRIPLIRR